ncbi:MAG: response regulator [Nanoarchaeota archaeon]|nr:response regulator [Nanoarchaeota archaeon]
MENLNEEIVNEILSFLEQKDFGASTSEVSKSTGRNRVTVSKYLEVMQASNIVTSKVVAQARFWQLSKEHTSSNILIVDDEDNVRDLVKLSLAPGQYNIFEAKNGIEALKFVDHTIPDLILLDLMMPKMDGIEVCNYLKRNVATNNIPIIMLTAKTMVHDKIKGLNIGADDYVTKPFDPLELEARVQAVLRRKDQLLKINYVTGLPGFELLIEEIKKTKAKMLFLDFTNFKKFNDEYGYKNGNEILQLFSRVVQTCIDRFGTKHDFLAHLGADDFVVLTYSNSEIISAQIKQMTRDLLPNLINKRLGISLKIKAVDSLDIQSEIQKGDLDRIMAKAKTV